MPYKGEIRPDRKGCIVFLLDQSSSMSEPFAGGSRSKQEVLVDAVNGWLESLVLRCTRSSGEVRDILDVGVIGYRTDGLGTPLVEPMFQGELTGRRLVSVSELSEHASCVEDEPTGFQRLTWVDGTAEGGTPMCAALECVRTILDDWVDEHPESAAPIVLHVTDGESSDGDPIRYAEGLRSLATDDGPVLLFNGLLEVATGNDLEFPASEAGLRDELARALYEMSSIVPSSRFGLPTNARGLVLATNEVSLNRFLELVSFTNIGTRPAGTRSRLDEIASPALESAPSTTNKTAPAPQPAPVRVDDNVQFTTYCPRRVAPDVESKVLAFVHLEELPPDADPDEPDPVEERDRQAKEVLGDKLNDYRSSTQESTSAVPREGELVFSLEFDDLRCTPAKQTIVWVDSVHRVEFHVKAPRILDGETRRGRLSVFLGDILLADTSLRIEVSSAVDASRPEPPARTAVRPYRRIFASYSRRDLVIVEQFERFARSMGDRYSRDLVDLQAGEDWNHGLERMIREADVFQLFWSSNSMRSEFVRREWEYALSLGRPNFVRPTYWEQPLPTEPPHLPPADLARIHFQLLGRYVDASGATDAPPPAPAAGPVPVAPVPAADRREDRARPQVFVPAELPPPKTLGEELSSEEYRSIIALEEGRPSTWERQPRTREKQHDRPRSTLRHYDTGDIVVVEGDSGNTAFYVLTTEDVISLRRTQIEAFEKIESFSAKTDGPTPAKSRDPREQFTDAQREELQETYRREIEECRSQGASGRVAPASALLNDGSKVDIESGEVFGEMSCLHRAPRSATVVVNRACYMLEMNAEVFGELPLNSVASARPSQNRPPTAEIELPKSTRTSGRKRLLIGGTLLAVVGLIALLLSRVL